MKKSDPTLVVSVAQTIKGQVIDVSCLIEAMYPRLNFFYILNSYVWNRIHLVRVGGEKIS